MLSPRCVMRFLPDPHLPPPPPPPPPPFALGDLIVHDEARGSLMKPGLVALRTPAGSLTWPLFPISAGNVRWRSAKALNATCVTRKRGWTFTNEWSLPLDWAHEELNFPFPPPRSDFDHLMNNDLRLSHILKYQLLVKELENSHTEFRTTQNDDVSCY